MKILLSAYACEPHRGSEPGVGWNWAIELAGLGHDVWVLTRSNNRKVIEAVLDTLPEELGLHFFYYDLPPWACWWKKGGRGVHLYYLLWQVGAFFCARRMHESESFNLVQHITFVSVRQPSFMGGLGIPFIFGPAAGGERCCWSLRAGFGFYGMLLDAIRGLANVLIKIDPLMFYTFSKADKIYVTSDQTREILPSRFRSKARVQLAIGTQLANTGTLGTMDQHQYRLLYVGRFLYWKGMHLGLLSFANLVKRVPSARLTMVGEGPDEERWKRQARSLGISDNIDWIPWVTQEELKHLYLSHHLLFFPSLHDSGGMVVLEAMASGLPVLCLDIGGPGTIVDDTCGRAISVHGLSKTEVVETMAEALLLMNADRDLLGRLRKGALVRVKSFTWTSAVSSVYGEGKRGIDPGNICES